MENRNPKDHSVLKFGGAALADGHAIARACERILAHGPQGTICVVSALKGVTDRLLQATQAAAQGEDHSEPLRLRHKSVCRELGMPPDLLDRLWRELQGLLELIRQAGQVQPAARDLALSFGERASARIVAQALRQSGVLATPVDAFDLGFQTTDGWTSLAPGVAERIAPALDQVPGIPIVTGFLAKDSKGNLTNLGRDGSDLTAAVIASATDADELIFWKDVPGILSADPTLVPGAFPIETVSVAEVRELAFDGNPILHAGTLEGRTFGQTRITVRSFQDWSAPGTQICPTIQRTHPVAVVASGPLVHMRFEDPSTERCQAMLASAMVRLGSAKLSARWIEQTADGSSLWFPATESTEALIAEMPPPSRVSYDSKTVSLVGEGIGQRGELVAHSLRVLNQAGVRSDNLHWTTTDNSLRFLTTSESQATLTRALHEKVLSAQIGTH